MKLYNTLTKQTEELQPLTNKVRIYTCGPTVYDHVTIGNLSSFIYADSLRRTISAEGRVVEHVMNFTDVDDKTIRRSQEKYPDVALGEALTKLTTTYGRTFLHDTQAVGNDIHDLTIVKATDYIPAMQQLIKQLYAKQFAYATDDGIYFSIADYQASGKIYGQLTDITADSTAQARIDNDEYDKSSVHDFALWKVKKDNEPFWPFELDGKQLDGRPGWHIECSAMSLAVLGQPFDIHTGGVDLMFPHHENEIAQSTALHDSALYAQMFMHNEHLLVDGKKMSKSLNNFHTLATLKERGFDPLAFRLFVLQAHYRTQAHFTWENLAAAQNRLRELRALAVLRYQARPLIQDASTFTLEEVPARLTEIMAEDLNTPAALAFLSTVITQLQTVLLEEDMVDHFEQMLRGLDDLLGLQLMAVPNLTDEQKQLLAQREAARVSQDWAQADALRQELADQNIVLRDTPSGAIWSRL